MLFSSFAILRSILWSAVCLGGVATDVENVLAAKIRPLRHHPNHTNSPPPPPLQWNPPSWWDFSRPEGSVNAAYSLIDRVLGDPTLKNAFDLAIVEGDRREKPWFRIEQQSLILGKNATTTMWHHLNANDTTSSSNIIIRITATSVSELTAGLGHYFKEYCNFTIEWSTGGRAGGSHIVIPKDWPVPIQTSIGEKSNSFGDHSVSVSVKRHRTVPWSYLMNVCTHSYSLVWYDWEAWQSLIDGLALRGINMILALTGQEEIQYHVFSQLGVQDHEIRSWFNGPAFLTWSRGQNEYGSGIGGPLPRSFMKTQWHLQRENILPRIRSLGIVGILPAFQGNVPIQIKTLFQDSNITKQGQTGWIDALDPLFGRIADMWMKKLIQDFGTDHYYQTDGYFNGGTAPWMEKVVNQGNPHGKTGETIRENNGASSDLPSHDENWYKRGRAAYSGLSRSDPEAVWMYQGFAFVGWNTKEQASYLKGFVDSAPANRFIIIDMGYTQDGQWQMWNNASFFGTPFIFTSLYNFGDTDGMRGDLNHVNEDVPFRAIEANASIVGIGATPEGIDHNPLYFDLLFETNFRYERIENLQHEIALRNHKRYGLIREDRKVTLASKLLLESVYSQGFSVRDLTGVSHMSPPASSSLFEDDRRTPKPILCKMFEAWRFLSQTAPLVGTWTEPFLYDLINIGREVLAQLSTAFALNFSEAVDSPILDRDRLISTGKQYHSLLEDLDEFVGQSRAFQLTPWIDASRRLATQDSNGGAQQDCFASILNNATEHHGCCLKFYEWNARCQITTWNPTPRMAAEIPNGPIDYASKHWHGLIVPYYTNRIEILLNRALFDQRHGRSLNKTVTNRLLARNAFEWTTNLCPSAFAGPPPTPGASEAVIQKYSHWFRSCSEFGDGSAKYIDFVA